jgi:hypothetical protein
MTTPKYAQTLVYIDSNIYLRFYDSNQLNFKQLLKSLIQLKENIFITRQIVDEVTRNKSSIFEQTFANYFKQVNQGFNNVQLPEHLDIGSNDKIKEWNKKRKSIKEQNDILIRELKDIYRTTFRQIISSSDEVSIGLEKVFKFAATESSEEFEKALRRKEIGNPPGKNGDCVGDQINWEQLLNKVQNIEKLIIISNDYDYFIEIDTELILNPLLKKELLRVNPSLEISCFNKLSHGLKSISERNHNKPLNLPRANILEQIIIDEPEHYINPQLLDTLDGFSTIHHNEHHKLVDELTRLNYMYGHAMITTSELRNRLNQLGASENIIDKIISLGYIPSLNKNFFLDFF